MEICPRGKFLRTKKQRLRSKMGCPKAIISETKGMIRNTILRSVNAISGGSRDEKGMGGLRGIGRLYNLEGDLAGLRKERESGNI